MAKKEETKAATKSVEVRQQTEEEIRKRLKHQGKIKDAPKDEDNGVHQLTEEEALLGIEDRKERLAQEAEEENPDVRLMTKKDVLLRQTAEKERAENKEDKDKKTSRPQTDADIKKRNEPDQGKEKETTEDKPEPLEIFAKDIVTFKDDDGELIIGKVKRVTAKNEAIVDTEEAEYTVPCADILTKEEKPGKGDK